MTKGKRLEEYRPMKIIKVEGSKVYFHNGVFLGEIFPEVDGFYVFYPDLKGGFWEAYVLRAIADYMDELNVPIQKDIEDYFERENHG